LAVAYGLSVSGCMLITTFLVFLIASKKWRWSKWSLTGLFVPLIMIDTTFVMTNLVKITEGAWYTVLITAFTTYVMYIWIRGSQALRDQQFVPNKSLRSFW